MLTPAPWMAATSPPPSAMKPADSTLAAATTRARRSSGAQAWRAVKVGTATKAPATASPARSTATRIVPGWARKAPSVAAVSAASSPQIVRARSKPKSAISAAPAGAGSRTMRPADIQAATPEPTAIETAKTARQAVTAISLPPRPFFTMDGSTDMTMAPASQNQEAIRAVRHKRVSARISRTSRHVERKMLASMTRSGAAGPVRGMKRLASQQAAAKAIIIGPNTSTDTPPLDATPATIVPARMAMNVAPSTQALARGNSLLSSRSGRMPYFTGPNSAEPTPNRNSAPISTGIEENAIPATAMTAAPASASFSRSAIAALSNRSASSPPSAESRRKGAMKMAPASVISEAASSAASLKRMRKTSVFLRKLSLNAARNCVQNSGAKRRDSIMCPCMKIIPRLVPAATLPWKHGPVVVEAGRSGAVVKNAVRNAPRRPRATAVRCAPRRAC